MMHRRTFFGVLGGALCSPLAARAQRVEVPTIGFLNSASRAPFADYVAAFRRGLQEEGYIEGGNLAIEFRWAEGQTDRLAALATDLVNRQVSVIAATGGPASAFAAQAATNTIPIVFPPGVNCASRTGCRPTTSRANLARSAASCAADCRTRPGRSVLARRNRDPRRNGARTLQRRTAPTALAFGRARHPPAHQPVPRPLAGSGGKMERPGQGRRRKQSRRRWARSAYAFTASRAETKRTLAGAPNAANDVPDIEVHRGAARRRSTWRISSSVIPATTATGRYGSRRS
jgi:hypothetical protein